MAILTQYLVYIFIYMQFGSQAKCCLINQSAEIYVNMTTEMVGNVLNCHFELWFQLEDRTD